MQKQKKVSVVCGLTLFFATIIIVSTWATRHTLNGGRRLPIPISQLIVFLSEVPPRFKGLLDLLKNLHPPEGGPNVYKNYSQINNNRTSAAGYLLIPWMDENGDSCVSLCNLKSGRSVKVLNSKDLQLKKQWTDSLLGSASRRQLAISSRFSIYNPVLTDEGDLIYTTPYNDLVSVNIFTKKGKWRVRGAFHHSIESDANGDYWVCGSVDSKKVAMENTDVVEMYYEEQALVKISKDGKILDSILVSDLIIKCGYEYLIYGVSNPNLNQDPIHLNQISPILKNTIGFRKGQLLVSMRNLSTIMLVDPEIKKIVWLKTGPWMNQHCVMQSGDTAFTVLDNHSFASGINWLQPDWRTRVLRYDIKNGETKEVIFGDLNFNNLRIPIQGRALFPENGVSIIEDSSRGTILVFENSKLVYKWSNIYPDGSVGQVSWCRYLSPTDILEDQLSHFLSNPKR